MKKLIFRTVLALTISVAFVSCKDTPEKTKEATTTEASEPVADANFGGLALYTVRDAMGEDAKKTLKPLQMRAIKI
ncbi:hypothetical protein LCGC14_0677750 [marine sediment metagenome]|uniref:Uncharacterized protein n=1 Tax=marine sediment metagenome TaxID=412755 RepID=A0A0F9QP36_9ZZZZ